MRIVDVREKAFSISSAMRRLKDLAA